MSRRWRRSTVFMPALVAWAMAPSLSVSPAAAAPKGELAWAVHISRAPAWFDPA